MINAKDNPFATRRLEALGYISHSSFLKEIEDRLESMNCRAAIVGPHGSGKTTLLDCLEKRARQRGTPTEKIFLSLDRKHSWDVIKKHFMEIPENGVLFFDGAGHLPTLRWMQLRLMMNRRRFGFLMTSHREGILPTLISCKPSASLLSDIVERLLGEDSPIEEKTLAEIYNRHSGDIRTCLRELYDEFSLCPKCQ